MTRETTNENPEPLKRLMSGAILSLVFGAIGYLLMFVFKVFSARIFDPEKFGMFEVSTTILNICALVASLGVQASIGRYLPIYEERGEHEKLKGYLRFAFSFPVLAALATSLIIFLSASLIRDFFNFDPIFVPMVQIVALIVPFRVINEIIYQIFYAKNQVFIQNISSNVFERVIPVFGLFFANFYHSDVTLLVWLFFFSVLLVFIFNIAYLRLRIHFKETDGFLNDYKEWLKFSTPLLFASVFNFVLNWTDNIAIGKIMTSRDVGIYAVSFSLASFLLFFQTSFVGVFFPIISRLYAQKKNEDISLIYGKAQNWAFGMSLPFGMIFIFFSREILSGIYGKSFDQASIPLIVLTIGYLFNVYTGMNPLILKLVKKTSYIFKTKLVLSVLNIALMILLIRFWGILGAAISVTLIVGLEQFLYLIKVREYLPVFHNNISNIKLLSASTILILCARMIMDYLDTPGDYFLLTSILTIYLVTYLIFSLFAKIFDKNDVIIFKQLLRNGRE